MFIVFFVRNARNKESAMSHPFTSKEVGFMKISPSCRYIAVVGLMFSILNVAAFGQENYSQWAHSKKLTINTTPTGFDVNEDVRNFPYPLRLTQSEFDFGQAAADGRDIRFVDSDGASCAYQIEQWDAVNGAATIWVKLALVRGNNETQYFTMYWGNSSVGSASNPGAVFSTEQGFSCVWHLAENPDANHGTARGDMDETCSVTGILGKALLFDGLDDYLDCGSNANLNVQGDQAFTISAWVKPSRLRYDGSIVSYGEAANDRIFSLVTDNTCVYSVHYGDDHHFGSTWALGKWQHVVIAYDPAGSTESLFVNGALVESWTPNNLNLPATGALNIGRSFWNNMLCENGYIDEVVISNTNRSSAWIKLCYQSQRIPLDGPAKISYPSKHIDFVANGTMDPVVPTIVGEFDSITLTPSELPDYVYFDNLTGIFAGWSEIDSIVDRPYIVRTYNAKGVAADTLYISFVGEGTDIQHALPEQGQNNGRLLLTDGTHRPLSTILIPDMGGLRELELRVYDLKGALVLTRSLMPRHSAEGVQAIALGDGAGKRGLSKGIYLVKLIMQANYTDVNGVATIHRIIVR
jgi:hypothetical protein